MLIIHQKRRIHSEIAAVIRKIEVGNADGATQNSPGMDGMGGMGGGMGGMF